MNCASYGVLVCVSMKASLIPPAHWCPWHFVILIWLWVEPRDLILTERLLYWNGMSLQELGHALRSILLIHTLPLLYPLAHSQKTICHTPGVPVERPKSQGVLTLR